jgi:valine--pyruvate aminotransferase
MNKLISKFQKRFTEDAGIVRLMDDLGEAQAGRRNNLMLGGGNPAHIPEVLQFFQERLERLAHNPAELAHVAGDYSPPQGDVKFIEALAQLLGKQYGWDIGPGNIALSTGSQSAFFMLFNMFAGEYEDGTHRKILLPLVPEYIGYSDVCLADHCLKANLPLVEMIDEHEFKYHVDFSQLTAGPDIGAICISRPTNPTGNLIPDEELARLSELALSSNLPLIIDNAYGMPFPNIMFSRASLMWEPHMILCMSLSKMGLPGVRTGIIIANEQVIAAVSKMNAIFSLAPGNFGPALALDLVVTGDILGLCNSVIKPYYQRKAVLAAAILKRELAGVDYYIHKTEGALFLWLWLPGLPGGCEQLYQRLKARSVLIVPGHYFFPGLDTDWPHRHECIRISYAMHDTVVEQGITIIADEIKKLASGDA